MNQERINNISCVIIVKDGVSTIEKTLDSLNFFEDVVVYDNGSTDGTTQIVKSYHNVNLVEGDFKGFGPTKNEALMHAKNDWILSLDADEVLSTEFVRTIKNIDLNENMIYSILRENYYRDIHVKHCWGNDIIIRIFNRKKTMFTDEKVHEKVIEDGCNLLSIDGVVRHYPYSTITEFIIKLDRYSTIFANANVGKKSSSPLKAILNGIFSFIKTFFFKRGFLDGYAGLIIAFSHMATNFYKYIKLYELNREL
ncbi:glycosyltransferase family 2 protein [Sulfurimonas sp.]|nr:glycosyltransferase family 2 protein [Sulfurimonas sp.]